MKGFYVNCTTEIRARDYRLRKGSGREGNTSTLQTIDTKADSVRESEASPRTLLPKRRTFEFCASRHSVISIAFFRQRLNMEEVGTGALVTELGARNKTFRGSLNCSYILLFCFFMLKS